MAGDLDECRDKCRVWWVLWEIASFRGPWPTIFTRRQLDLLNVNKLHFLAHTKALEIHMRCQCFIRALFGAHMILDDYRKLTPDCPTRFENGFLA